MQHSMNNHPMEFLLKRGIKEVGIFAHTLDTNQYVARDDIAFHIIEGDDIGIGIMVEVGLVDTYEIGIVGGGEGLLPPPQGQGEAA